MKKETELAYVAGLFDGEGCYHYIKAKRKRVEDKYYPQIIIEMTSREPLDFIMRVLKMGTIKTVLKKDPKHSNTYRYVLTSSGEVLRFFESLEPYLLIKRINEPSNKKKVPDKFILKL